MPSGGKTYTLKQIMTAAQSLLEQPNQEQSEYARGICELIGRLRLDFGGQGEGTGENAAKVARLLHVRI